MQMIREETCRPRRRHRPLRKLRARPSDEALCLSAASLWGWSNVASLATWRASLRCVTCPAIC